MSMKLSEQESYVVIPRAGLSFHRILADPNSHRNNLFLISIHNILYLYWRIYDSRDQ